MRDPKKPGEAVLQGGATRGAVGLRRSGILGWGGGPERSRRQESSARSVSGFVFVGWLVLPNFFPSSGNWEIGKIGRMGIIRLATEIVGSCGVRARGGYTATKWRGGAGSGAVASRRPLWRL